MQLISEPLASARFFLRPNKNISLSRMITPATKIMIAISKPGPRTQLRNSISLIGVSSLIVAYLYYFANRLLFF